MVGTIKEKVNLNVKAMIYTLEQLKEGDVLCINDGTPEQLEAVLKHTFNGNYESRSVFGGNVTKYFYKRDIDYHKLKLPTQSVKEFYKQLQPQFEVGRWYKVCDKEHYMKFSELVGQNPYADEWINRDYYRCGNMYSKRDTFELLTDLSEIQQYLPDNHLDKIKTMKKQYLTRKQLVDLWKADNCPEWKSIIGCYLNLSVVESDDFQMEVKQHDIDYAYHNCKFSQKQLLTKAGLILNQEISVCDSLHGNCIEVNNYYYVNRNNFICVFMYLNDTYELKFIDKPSNFKNVKGTLVKEPVSLNIKIN